ncbi:MAG: FtsX-like permease family protein, partial [Promethearchaeota archaeon]
EFEITEWFEFIQTSSRDFYPQNQEDFTYTILPTEFYQSSRFTEYFTIYQGSAPAKNTEILIDYSYALANNISVGDSISYNYSSEGNDDEFFTEVLNTTVSYEIDFVIAGIFLPNRPEVKILTSNFQFPWYKDPFTQEITFNNDFSGYYYGRYPVFSTFNFSQSIPHPIQTMWNNVSNQILSLTGRKVDFTRHYIGLMGIYDRESYSYRNLLTTSYELITQGNEIEDELLPKQRLGYHIGRYLRRYAQEMQSLRIITQFMNLPIIGFGIFIGVFSFGINTKERSDEFLLLRSKGIPQRMVRNNFLMEATLLGIASSTLALFVGRGTYEIFKNSMGQILETDFYTPLLFRISVGSVLAIYGIGVAMAIISCLPAIRSINKLESSELLGSLGSDNFDVAYDETTLFTVNPNQKVTLADTPFLQTNQTSLLSAEKTHLEAKNITKKLAFWKKFIKPRDSTATLYRNTLKKKERKIRKRGVLLVSVSLLPVIYYGIIKLSQLPTVPDTILLIGEKLQQWFPFFIIVAALSPLLLVIGISRLIIKENPSRFARIIKWVARPFVRQKDYLVALQMIKQKDIRRFINLLAIFTSLFAFANIFFVSFNAVEIINHNYEVGADAHLEYHGDFIAETIGNLPGGYTESNFLAFEQNATLSMTNTSQDFIRDSAFYVDFYRRADHRGTSHEFFINISKYVTLIQEDGKVLPSHTYAQQLSNVEATLQAEDNPQYPQVIVTDDFLTTYEKKIGDTVEVEHTTFYLWTNLTYTHTLTVEIIAALPFFLGIWEFVPYSWYPHTGMIMDISLVDEIPLVWDEEGYDWDQPYFGHLFDVYEEYTQSSEQMQPLFISALPHLMGGNEINYYYPNIRDVENTPGDISTIYFVYRIIYMEFFIIGAITALSLAIFMLGMLRKNKYLNGLMLSRGMGWRGLNKFMLVQLGIVLVLALGMGLLSGAFSAIVLLKIHHEVDLGGNYYPLLARPWDFLAMFGSIIGLTVISYGVTFYLESKKNITEYFHKF